MTAYKFRRYCKLTWVLTGPLVFLFIVMGILTELNELFWVGIGLSAIFIVALVTHSIMWMDGIGERPDSWTIDDIIKDRLRKAGCPEEEVERYVRNLRPQTNAQTASAQRSTDQ